MSSKARTGSESSDVPHARRKATKRITSPVDDDDAAAGPPLKRARLDGSDGESLSPETSRQPARPAASGSRAKTKQTPKKRTKVVVSDPESEEFEFDPVDESEPEMLMEDDDDEYMSEPKSTGKRVGGTKGKAAKGGKGKKKPEPKEIMARDERKRPIQETAESTAAPATKRARTKPAQKSGAEIVVDVVGDASAVPSGTPPPREDAVPAPAKKKLPPIKKNKSVTGASAVPAASGAVTSTPSIPAKPAPLIAEESKLPLPVVGAGTRKTTLPASADVDLSNPMMYAALFNKSGGGSTPSGFTRREKDEERRKELNRMRDEARAKRINEAAPPFDLQGQMDKIARFEEKLRNSRSPAVYPNFIAGGLKALQAGKKCYGAGNDLEAREEGEM
ncbi:hypothetical protein K438DRAFT_2010496 [Mycena galopus ATCC 62051]|nr:hypothetical protein K438DRAFT_2010496 [Mycena galopus ATCC 62051]